jgi:hypothetical protein
MRRISALPVMFDRNTSAFPSIVVSIVLRVGMQQIDWLHHSASSRCNLAWVDICPIKRLCIVRLA